MTAMKLSLRIEQGTTWAHGFLPLLNGVQLIQSGWTARAQARSSVSSKKILHSWDTVEGNIGADPNTGAITLTVDPAESSAWKWTDAVYDVEAVSPDGDMVYRVAQGSIKVNAEVTR